MCATADELRARQLVGLRLRGMREAAGFTLDVAAGHLHLPAGMLERMECGQHAVPPPLAQAMTQMYGQSDPEVLILARLARHRGEAADLAAWNLDQLAWESCATRICDVAVTHIPELLRTSAYARAAFVPPIRWRQRGGAAERSIQTGLTALTLRQERLAGPPLLPTHVVITERALRAQVAEPSVMAEQWAHLVAVIARCAVTVQVLPRTRSGLVGSQHGWRVLEFLNTPEPRWLFRRYSRVTAPTEEEEDVATAYRKFLVDPYSEMGVADRIEAELASPLLKVVLVDDSPGYVVLVCDSLVEVPGSPHGVDARALVPLVRDGHLGVEVGGVDSVCPGLALYRFGECRDDQQGAWTGVCGECREHGCQVVVVVDVGQ